MKKRLLSLALVLCMVFTLLPISAFAAGVVAKGPCGDQGDNVTWTLDSDGTLTISGEGNMKDYSSPEDSIWYSYRNDIKTIVIDSGVTSIGEFAFYTCKQVSSVTIPNSVRKIGAYAFRFCFGLTSVMIPDSVRIIGSYAFDDCIGLTSVTISNGVTIIGDYAFYNCYLLTNVTIPDSVTSIGDAVFYYCRNLQSITIGSGVTRIGANVFTECKNLSDVYYNGTQEQWNRIGGNNVHIYHATVHFHEHSYTAIVTAPTCAEAGYTTFTCECGDSYTDNYVEALGHKTVVKNAKIATCTEDGYTGDTVCTECGLYVELGKVIEKFGHNYAAVVTEPTCTEKGYTTYTCSVCGDSYIDSYVDALGHDFGEWTVTIPATCTEKGVDTRYCSRCDVFETREVNAIGHDLVHHDGKTATCTENGWEAYDTCSSCDYTNYKEISAKGHSYTAIVTEPTCTEQGYTTYTCACGDSYVADYTDALGHHYVGGVCTECGDTILVPALNIIQPSRTNIEYGETLVIRANVDNAPEGAKVIWSFEGNGAGYEVSPDGMTCYVSCVDSGSVKVTATLVDENGNVITVDGNAVSDNISVSLKGGFLYKIISWFKDIFKIDRRVMSLFADYKYVY